MKKPLNLNIGQVILKGNQAGPKRSAGPGRHRRFWIQFTVPRSGFMHGLFAFVIVAIGFTAPAFAQREAQLPWWDRAAERWIGPYWIKSDLPAEQVNAIGRHLNILHREFGRALGAVPVRVTEKLNVLIFSSKDEFNLTLRTRYALKPPDTGGWLIAPADHLLALWTEGLPPREVEQLIQREAFEQFAYNRFGYDLPRWLNDGLAEVFGDAVVIGDSLFAGRLTEREVTHVQEHIAAGKYIPFATMLNITSGEWILAQQELSSAWPALQAKAMALFVLQPTYSEPFTRYMQHLNSALPPDHALWRTFGSDPTAFEAAWKQFVEQLTPSALATALERVEFLAEGALELARRKVFPSSLNEFKAALRNIKFTWTRPTRFGDVVWSADDDSLFMIPRDALSTRQPVFDVGRSRTPPTRREQALEKENPSPVAITTQHLRPSNIHVMWQRDEANKSFTYQIVVR